MTLRITRPVMTNAYSRGFPHRVAQYPQTDTIFNRTQTMLEEPQKADQDEKHVTLSAYRPALCVVFYMSDADRRPVPAVYKRLACDSHLA